MTFAHSIGWFEIPATDFDRAVTFYSTILGKTISKGEFLGLPYGFFPESSGNTNVSGAIVAGEGYQPTDKGVLVYLHAANDLAGILARVEAAGGRVIMPATDIGDPGAIGVFIDTEGNRVGLLAPRQ